MNTATRHSSPDFQVRFEFLHQPGRAYTFPCDPQGQVDLDRLSGPARENYFFARAMVGRDFSVPVIVH